MECQQWNDNSNSYKRISQWIHQHYIYRKWRRSPYWDSQWESEKETGKKPKRFYFYCCHFSISVSIFKLSIFIYIYVYKHFQLKKKLSHMVLCTVIWQRKKKIPQYITKVFPFQYLFTMLITWLFCCRISLNFVHIWYFVYSCILFQLVLLYAIIFFLTKWERWRSWLGLWNELHLSSQYQHFGINQNFGIYNWIAK